MKNVKTLQEKLRLKAQRKIEGLFSNDTITALDYITVGELREAVLEPNINNDNKAGYALKNWFGLREIVIEKALDEIEEQVTEGFIQDVEYLKDELISLDN